MESPVQVGDITTNSIQMKLDSTHLAQKWTSSLEAATYGEYKVIQLNINPKPNDPSLIVLRRVYDSYINITQLLEILVKLDHLTPTQRDNFINNDILSNVAYLEDSSKPQFNNLTSSKTKELRGVWVPYGRAVALALRFDLYDVTKKLFLIDVHSFDQLPQVNHKRHLEESSTDSSLVGSPSKKQKVEKEDEFNEQALVKKIAHENSNAPFTLAAYFTGDHEVESEIKRKYSEVFKLDEQGDLTLETVKAIFKEFSEKDIVIDIPLDQQGQTALHFAATLLSPNLVAFLIRLGLNSPIRGNVKGESPLISAIQVTNAMEKGNFPQLLSHWLWPDLWLYSTKKWSFLHYLVSQPLKKFESSKFYLCKILEFIVPNEKFLNTLVQKVVNLQDEDNGSTALHLAAETESRWFIKVLLTLKADVNIANNLGVKPRDYELVRDVQQQQFDDHLIELVKTSIEFLDKRLEANEEIGDLEDFTKPSVIKSSIVSSNKILQSIQELLNNTNGEYESIINAKKQQIVKLNKSLRDSTITTANNRYLAKKVKEKLAHLDNLKLQIANITDKLQLSKRENADEELHEEVNADEPFAIRELYDKISRNEDISSLRNDSEFLGSLPSTNVLKARIKSYQELNSGIEAELGHLADYGKLTAKFKKVVGICTGVDTKDVDELLDGLLEAVEGQQ